MSAMNTTDALVLRLRVLLAGMLMAFVCLAAFLWRIQVTRGGDYQNDLKRQSIRRVRLPGMRGRIYDRAGVRLADNRPNYCIAIYPEEVQGNKASILDRLHDRVMQLSEILQVEPQLTREKIRTHIRRRLPLPLIAWRGLDEDVMARWAEQAVDIAGVDAYAEAVRVYPQRSRASHLIGYVGRADPVQDEAEPFDYYVPEMEGKCGLEKHFDEILRGRAGGRLLRVNVAGFRHEDIALRKPEAGKDLLLAINSDIQAAAEKAISGRIGAAVVLNPQNGDVLALASSPSFDLNDFVPSISTEKWNAILENPGKPLLNRAINGRYTPGSIFKPVVALTALENGVASADTTFDCPGFFEVGKARFNCWYHPGHGVLDMREALQHSCNVYFFHLGLQCGPEAMAHMAGALGLGRKTGIALDSESAGLVPDPAWKLRKYQDGWRDGDSCNVSIGQGALTVTPLQMAVMTATIANGGRVYRPRLVLGTKARGEKLFRPTPPQLVNNMNWDPANIHAVQEGMEMVVMSPQGSGRKAAIDGIRVAGKTGTAEYGPKGAGLKYAWMIAYAPAEKPRFAVAIVIEKGVSGGTTAAPRMRILLQALFGQNQDRERAAG